MTDILKDLQPGKVFQYFEAISNIPRGSGNEKAISDYMVNFATELGLEVKQDEAYNIYIKKPATPGFENAPTVILQGHLDMVCEKNKETEHDFSKDGLELVIDGDWIRAKGTTLGADNGVAIAYQMAVLADNTLKHPAIECLMTTDEERGMTGVAGMHPEYLSGKILLNLDTDVEGEFLVSCAGGAKVFMSYPLETEVVKAGFVSYTLTINGLVGGHSGADIHFERGNAHLLMARVLDDLRNKVDFHLAHIVGGSKDNVITRECEVTLLFDANSFEAVKNIVLEKEATFKAEYSKQDPDVKITLQEVAMPQIALTMPLRDKIIDFMIALPNGVMGYDQNMKGLVQTSLNLGIVQIEESHIAFGAAIRSSVATKKEELIKKLEVISKYFGADFKVMGAYPAWQYNENSKVRDEAITLYKKMYGTEPTITAIHAGLECGFISEKLPDLDMIAFGPNVKDIHSPEERASISSMARVYEYLVKLLETLGTN